MRLRQIKTLCQQDPILQHVDIESCISNIKLIHFLPQQQLQISEQDVYFLIQGEVKIGHLHADGKMQVYQYLKTAKVFNLVACIQKKPLHYHYFAVRAGQLLHIPQAIFLQQLHHNPQLQAAILEVFSTRLWQSFEQQRYRVAATRQQQIAYQLLHLAEQQSEHNDVIDISQQEFADLLQISRQTLHKQLSSFLKFGLIEWRYHQVKLLDRKQIAQWAALV